MRRLCLVLAAAAALVFAPAGAAHVTVNPNQAAPGSFIRLAVQVPNEEEGAATVKVAVRLPAGLGEVSFQPKAGWKRSVAGRTVTWSGGRIEPGEFDEFVISTELPDTPGRTLMFPAIQTYSNGKVVHWIGPANADEPAPHVQLLAPALGTSTAIVSSSADDGRENLALGFGIAGLVVGLTALGVTLLRRRA
jgi:periplasmic copper chaperone A